MVGREAVVSSYLEFFSARYTATSAIQWPGLPLDTADRSEWVRPWVETIEHEPSRRTGTDRGRVRLGVECFSRLGPNAYRTEELADAAAAVLHQAVIPVYEAGASGSGAQGYLVVGEVQVGAPQRPAAAQGTGLTSLAVWAEARLESV